jgi:glucokinase
VLKTILGFDIGGSKIGVVEGDRQGMTYQHESVSNGADVPFELAFTRMAELAVQVLARSHHQPSALSVSIGGPLQIEQGIIYAPPNLPLWDRVPLKARLVERFGLPVYVEHDGNAGALAEWRFGAGKDVGAQNLIFLTMGTGLGAGLILNGRIYRGSNDLAGEVGHIKIADHGLKAYGKVGSWEAVCSGAGLVNLAARWPGRWTTPREVIRAALSGDADARVLVEEVGVWLGRGIAVLVDVLNPQLVIVGTLGAVLGDLLLEPARRVVREEALPLAAQVCHIVPAQLGDRLGQVAALMAAIEA